MNKKNLNQIFQHYIEQFDYINNSVNMEFYKWKVCKDFPELMQKALDASNDELADVLKEVKQCTYNIIDGYTQPLSGLIELAKKEPEEVRSILKELYADGDEDIELQMKKIGIFFKKYNTLLER